jgi:hypothetical protein
MNCLHNTIYATPRSCICSPPQLHIKRRACSSPQLRIKDVHAALNIFYISNQSISQQHDSQTLGTISAPPDINDLHHDFKAARRVTQPQQVRKSQATPISILRISQSAAKLSKAIRHHLHWFPWPRQLARPGLPPSS